MDKKIDTSSIAIGTPLENYKGIHRDEIESSCMVIDGVLVSKKPSFLKARKLKLKVKKIV